MRVGVMGVHLEEPASPATDRWSGHGTSPVKNQWTEEDLDAFVKQLSNPQHHVTKCSSRDQPHLPIVRKSSLDLTQGTKERQKIRGLLARSETDASSSFLDLHFLEKDKAARSEDVDSKAEGLSHGFSGLRLLKNPKSAKTSHATAKRHTLQKSRENCQPSSLIHEDVDEDAEASETLGDDAAVLPVHCSSSPECSDSEVCGDMKTLEQASNDTSKDGGKKRRFRKMLTRPLNRSHSAGCAKDVPAHALFLNQQRKSGQEPELDETKKSRSSEGDIRPSRDADENEDPEEDSAQSHFSISDSSSSQTGLIHKTKSSDSALLSTDDLGVVSHHKSKSRNIAKKISRKMLFLRRRHTDSTLGVMGKDEGARRLATVDPEEAKEWSKSFENLLFDKTGLELFRGFLMTEHSDENIEFWIACENYKTSKSNKQLPTLALKIFNDYVAVQSKKEINLDSKTRTFTYESVTSNPNRQTFDEAQRRVQALMEKDSYRRFLESEIYQDLASGNLQHKS